MKHHSFFRSVFLMLLLSLGLSGCTPTQAATPTQISAEADTDTQTTLHVLDVGQGLSVLIESDGHYALYDGGDSHASSQVVSYLKQEGVTELDCVIASHYDSDHLNGIVGVLNSIPTSLVLSPDYTTTTKIFQSFQSVLQTKQIENHTPKVGDHISLGTATLEILAPYSDSYSDFNNYSIVLRVTDGTTSFLITGDAESESEEEMVEQGLLSDCNVYVVGHHGSASSTTWDLLQATVPEYAIISCGAGNSYGHPHAETMEKLKVMEIDVFRTDLQGTIRASTDGETITWNTEPCNDYSSGNETDLLPQPQQTQAVTVTYILNTNTKKFHLPECSYANAIKEQNRKESSESRQALFEQGYEACKNCKP